MVKSQNQNVHIWNPIVDTFMIFTSSYVLASLSVMTPAQDLKTVYFSMFLTVLVIENKLIM